MRFLVYFFSSANDNFLFFSPEMGDKYCSIFEMVYWNRISLMILVNDIKFIHLLPIFLTFSCPFAMQGYVIHEFIRILLISLQALSATEWYSLNEYNVNYAILKIFEVVYLHQHTVVAGITCMAMKIFSKNWRIVLVAEFFTDQNWVSKIVF